MPLLTPVKPPQSMDSPDIQLDEMVLDSIQTLIPGQHIANAV